MPIKIDDPDTARILKTLRFETTQALTSFDNYITSKDGDGSHLAEALQNVRNVKILLGVFELLADRKVDNSQMHFQMASNVIWDVGQFE